MKKAVKISKIGIQPSERTIRHERYYAVVR